MSYLMERGRAEHFQAAAGGKPPNERAAGLFPRPESRRASAAGQRTTAPTGGRFCNLRTSFERRMWRHHKARCPGRGAPTRGRALPGTPDRVRHVAPRRQQAGTNGF